MKTRVTSDYMPPVCAAGVHVANVGATACQCGARRYGEATPPPTEDAVWNAAIEAAADKIEAAFLENDMPSTAQESAAIIRALKREAK